MIWTFKISRIPGPMLQSVQLCDLVSIRLKHTVNLPTICLKHTKMYDMICHDSHTIFFPDGNIETVNYRKKHETPIFGGQNLHVSRFDFPVSLCQATLRNPHILFLVQLVDGRDPLEIPRPIHGIQKTSAVVRWSTIMALLAHGCSDARWSLLRKPMHFGGVHGHRGTPIHGWFIRVINHL